MICRRTHNKQANKNKAAIGLSSMAKKNVSDSVMVVI